MAAVVQKTKLVLTMTGNFLNDVLSLIVFTLLDVLDFVLCYVYKIMDFFIEADWKPCYCSSAKEAITSSGKILLSEQGEPKKIVRLTSSQLQLEEISDTLYTRPSLVYEVSKSTVKRLKVEGNSSGSGSSMIQSCEKIKKRRTVRSTFTINSTIVEMLQGRIGGQQSLPIPRWSDCDCKTCTSWTSSCKETLFVKADGAKDNVQEDVLFIHGFISSSAFWTETLYPNFSKSAKSKYRLFAVDLLGFGRSPKPTDSLYTLREHLDMIERSVLEPYKVKGFHIVAHSLGCILALALAVKHPGSVKSLTLLAPPYFPPPKGERATQYMMRRVAPRRVWPFIAFGASIACWYEHISRTICLLICKNHRLWEFLTKLITRNREEQIVNEVFNVALNSIKIQCKRPQGTSPSGKGEDEEIQLYLRLLRQEFESGNMDLALRIRTYLMEGFFLHTHNAAWHTLHNIICGTAGKIEEYLDEVKNRLKCHITIYHGKDDELIPVECSYNVQSRIPRAHVKVFEKKDHITIVVGRQKAFARELEEIWRSASG